MKKFWNQSTPWKAAFLAHLWSGLGLPARPPATARVKLGQASSSMVKPKKLQKQTPAGHAIRLMRLIPSTTCVNP